MAKPRKMLGRPDSEVCQRIMAFMETQSRKTLAAWAVSFAAQRYLPICESGLPEDTSLPDAVTACRAYLAGERSLKAVKPYLKAAVDTARGLEDRPVIQAAARAVATACGTIQTPTNALGFLFYGAAASAYAQVGLQAEKETYEALALREFQEAYDSLQAVAVPEEEDPAKLNWNC